VIATGLYLGVTILDAFLPIIGFVSVMCTLGAGILIGRYAPHPLYAVAGPLVLVLLTIALGAWGVFFTSVGTASAIFALAIDQSLSAATLCLGSFTGYVTV
jgi:hypothetical protein